MTNTGCYSKDKAPTPLEPVEVPVHGSDGSSQGSRTFTPGVVYNYPNIALLKEAVRRQQGRLRRGTASTKTRSEIRGSNAKPWRQKGTGRARCGTRKSPLWRGGGTVFGPKPRSYDYGLPHKQRRMAIRHALLSKVLDAETSIVESFTLEKPSAGAVEAVLGNVGVTESCLIGVASDMDRAQLRDLVLSCRNLKGIRVLQVRDFDALSLLKHRRLVVTLAAFDEIQKAEAGSEEGDQA